MNRIVVLMCIFVSASLCLASEQYAVVQVTGFDKSTEYRALNAEEQAAFVDELRREGQIFVKIMNAAKSAWAKDESKTGKWFPALSKRSMKVVKAYPDKNSAIEKLKTYAKSEDDAAQDGKLSEKQMLLTDAITLVNAQLSAISDGKLTGSIPGIAPAIDSEKPEGSGKPTPIKIENYKFGFIGTLYKTLGASTYYVNPDTGILFEGKPARPLQLTAQAKKFGVDDTWIEKKVKVGGICELVFTPNKTYVFLAEAKFDVLELLEADKDSGGNPK